MRLHANAEVRVAGRTSAHAGIPLPRKADPLPVLHPRRDLDGESPGRPAVLSRNLDHLLGALVGLRESDLDLALDILALSSARSRPRTCATEHVVRVGEPAVRGLSKEGAEEVGEPTRIVAERVLARLSRVHVLEAAGPRGTSAPLRELLPLGSDSVISLSLVGIAQDFVSLVDLLEAPLGVRLLVDVRVVLTRELPVGLLDVVGRGVLRNAQRLVVVLVLDRHRFRPRKLVRWRGRRDARTRRLDLRGGHVRSGQQRRLEHLVDRFHELDVDRVDDLLRYIDEILLVLLRHEEDLDPGAVRREQLLLHAADGQDESTERDLAGHRDVLADLATGQCRHDRRRHGHAGRRTVLGDGPRRHVDVHGVVLEEALRHAELRVVRSHVAERRDGRLFHDLLDLTGEDELLLLRSLVHDRRLDREDVAAVLGHRNAGGRADLVFLLGQTVVVPLGTEVRREVLGLDLDRLGLALGDRARDLAVDRADLPLEVADAGLARVLADEPEERVVAHHQLAFLEAVLLQLLRQEEALRDMHLLVLGVAGEPDDLHAVAERRDDRVLDVRGRDEDHLGEVVRHLEVVVAERVVLLGVEDLEERRARVTAEVRADLVDLVEHEHGVDLSRGLHVLQDAAGERAHVGAPVAADLGLVADAAERHADELAAHRASDGLAEARLADAGRADEAEDGRAQVVAELAHGHVLDDPVLHLRQAVVVLVEDLRGLGDVPVVARRLVPGQRDEPVHIGPDDAGLRRGLRDLLETAHFLEGLLLHRVGHAGLFDLLLELAPLRATLVLAALLLARLHLLAEDVLALRLVEGLLDLALDLRLQLEDLVLLREEDREELEALDERPRLEQLLALLEREVGARRDEVGEVRGILGVLRRHRDLRQDRATVVDVLLEEGAHAADERLALDRVPEILGERLERRAEEALLRLVAGDPDALEALDDDLGAAVGDAQEAHDLGDGADAVDLLGRYVVDLGVALRREDDVVFLLGHRRIDGGDALLTTDPERDHELREHDRFAQRHERQVARVGIPLRVGDRGGRLGVGHSSSLSLSDLTACVTWLLVVLFALILIVRGLVLSAFGTTSSRTPFVNFASTLFGSICTGRVKARWNFPARRS